VWYLKGKKQVGRFSSEGKLGLLFLSATAL
jgi:hypothetical protein